MLKKVQMRGRQRSRWALQHPAKIGGVNARARHCLACGARLKAVTEEGRRRQRCPRCGWTFYDNPVPAAVALIRGPRGILLTRRGRPPYAGTWDLPGGFLEAGETPDRGLVRELREELGVRGTLTRLLGFFPDQYGPGGFPVLAIVYAARLSGPAKARSDVAEVRWFRADAIPWRDIASPSMRQALRASVTPKTAAPRPPARRILRAGRRIPTERGDRSHEHSDKQ
jgi:ADP-ribose pyrophosphatase YjhB (NUDIX family)